MRKLHRSALNAAQILFLAVALWFVVHTVAAQWDEVRAVARNLSVSWVLVAGSALVVLIAYLVLIQAWRGLLREWNAELTLLAAMRIWFVSVLGRYIPGRVWSVAAVAVMGKRAGISPVTAAGSAMLLTVVNTLVGGIVLLGTGGPHVLSRALGSADIPIPPAVSGLLFAVPLAAMFLLPFAVGPISRLGARLTGRSLQLPELRTAVLLKVVAACTTAWALYGVAFWIFCLGVFGSAGGGPLDFIEVYTGSYLAGYLAVIFPGGIIVRELALQSFLPALGILSPAQAVVAAWTSRLWLTLLEVLPGVVLVFVGTGHRGPRDEVHDDHP